MSTPFNPQTGGVPQHRRVPRRLTVAVAVASLSCVAWLAPTVDAQFEPSPTSTSSTTTTTASDGDDNEESNGVGGRVEPGRIAWVTPTRDLMIAKADGTEERKIGADVARNRVGLSPLAWSPTGDRIAYVRPSGQLVVASTNGAGETVVATDAVVPSDSDETTVSFDVSGSTVAYLGGSQDRWNAVVVNLESGLSEALNDPDARQILGMRYSSSDPFLYLLSRDAETGAPFTVSLIEPVAGRIFPTPWAYEDPTFSPDGEYLVAVAPSQKADQLVRIDTTRGRPEVIADRDQICQPAVSPDAREVIFAAGELCDEVWVVDIDGTDLRQVVRSVGSSQSFAEGAFTWSLDGSVVSHPACRVLDVGMACGGAYWDIDPQGSPEGRSAIVARQEAGSVSRETAPLIRAAKVEVQFRGSVNYSGKLLVSPESVGKLLSDPSGSVVEAKVVDELDEGRFLSLKLQHTDRSRFLNGLLRISDAGGGTTTQSDVSGGSTTTLVPLGSIPPDQVSSTVAQAPGGGEADESDSGGDGGEVADDSEVEREPIDETVYVFVSAIAISFRYAELQGIWMQTDRFPWRTGTMTLKVTR